MYRVHKEGSDFRKLRSSRDIHKVNSVQHRVSHTYLSKTGLGPPRGLSPHQVERDLDRTKSFVMLDIANVHYDNFLHG
jgi:hypothetical protein